MEIKSIYRISCYLFAFAMILLLSVTPTLAKTVTYVKEYTYQASELDSKLSSRTIALTQVKKLLLEELGTYLISESAVKDFELTKDQVSSLTAGIVTTVIIDENWDGKTYFLKAKISTDTDELIRSINNVRKNQEQNKNWEEVRGKTEEALKEIEKLRKDMEGGKGERVSKEKYAKAVNELNVLDGRFIAYDNGTVLDKSTNLMWAAKDNGSNITWTNAKRYCENYRRGGYTDWRMPTQDELEGLYDFVKTYKTDCGRDAHLTELILITCTATWASETSGSTAAIFGFDPGKRLSVPQSRDHGTRALPVRSYK
jgi:hypothetical protein